MINISKLAFHIVMKKLILYIGLFSMSFVIKAQISHPIAKPQWNEASNALSSNAPIQIEKPDLQAIFIEDSINALDKHSSWRFGYAIDRNVDVIELANREEQNGMLKFSLQLNAEDAKSLNFNFNLFHLSENSLLYFTSLDAKDQIGAITAANNKIDNQFSTRPIKGSAVLIELFVPISELEEVDVEISQVIYGYRDFFGKGGKTFNSSGGCNVNINCPEADLWQDVRRSVVLITASDNQRLCTGTLVNNVREDSIPYLLTASHCMLATNSIFILRGIVRPMPTGAWPIVLAGRYLELKTPIQTLNYLNYRKHLHCRTIPIMRVGMLQEYPLMNQLPSTTPVVI